MAPSTLSPAAVGGNDSIEVQAVLCEGPGLIKADQFDLPTQVHPLGADAVDPLLPQPVQGVDRANSEGSREGWRNHNGDHVQGAEDCLFGLVVLEEVDGQCVHKAQGS